MAVRCAVLEARRSTTGRTPWAVSFRAADPHKIPIDPNGNLTSKTEGTDSWVYTWNAENQLTKVEKNGAEQARFAYDPLERRSESSSAGVTVTYIYDGDNILVERSGSTLFKYIHRATVDRPLAREDAAGTVEYYHADALGSVVARTDQSGARTNERRFDVWGGIEAGSAAGGYAFTGREWNPEAGLYYYRARYYDPEAGRFISEDPIGLQGGLNFYSYVDNSPTNLVDPFGLQVYSKYSLPCEALEWASCARTCGKRGVKWCMAHFTLVPFYRSRPGEADMTGYRWDKRIDCQCNDEKPPKPKPPITLVPPNTSEVCPVIIVDPCVIMPWMCCEGRFTGPAGCAVVGGT